MFKVKNKIVRMMSFGIFIINLVTLALLTQSLFLQLYLISYWVRALQAVDQIIESFSVSTGVSRTL